MFAIGKQNFSSLQKNKLKSVKVQKNYILLVKVCLIVNTARS